MAAQSVVPAASALSSASMGISQTLMSVDALCVSARTAFRLESEYYCYLRCVQISRFEVRSQCVGGHASTLCRPQRTAVACSCSSLLTLVVAAELVHALLFTTLVVVVVTALLLIAMSKHACSNSMTLILLSCLLYVPFAALNVCRLAKSPLRKVLIVWS